MRSVATLAECIKCIEAGDSPKVWAARLGAIESEHAHLQSLVDDPSVRVYGANTLVGHRDDEGVSEPDAIASEILRTHAIAGPPWYDQHAAKCIGYAKMYSWAAGLSGVSRELFEGVQDLLVDPDFVPKIPRASSCSCGDVIPAATDVVATQTVTRRVQGAN